MKDVKEALELAFRLAKKQGVILRRVEFDYVSSKSVSSNTQYVQLKEMDIHAVTMLDGQE